ncbi:MAG: AAA domain-containing protein [Symploca sp. SIO2E9]|nr:AAA domain-containing protein [Symploca sp. SIO2E9]
MSVNDWRIFQGNREPHNGIKRLLGIEPPSWRRFGSLPDIDNNQSRKYWHSLHKLANSKDNARDLERGRTFRVRENQSEVLDAINAALYLRRPVLVTGKPGSGKTSLAYALAYELRLGPVLLWSITARSILQEGLYRYDAIARLQDAQLSKDNQDNYSGKDNRDNPSSEDDNGYLNIGQYIRLGSLGTAFLPSKYPRVLLIDEIDKSDINLPNDLLNLLEEGEFKIPELVRLSKRGGKSQVVESEDGIDVTIEEGKVRCHAFPIIVMTSNGERDFPPAFYRRCLRVQMPNPTEEDLRDIVTAHLGAETMEKFQTLIQEFIDKNESEESGLATDQLLNTVYLLAQNADKESLKKLLFSPLSSLEEGR